MKAFQFRLIYKILCQICTSCRREQLGMISCPCTLNRNRSSSSLFKKDRADGYILFVLNVTVFMLCSKRYYFCLSKCLDICNRQQVIFQMCGLLGVTAPKLSVYFRSRGEILFLFLLDLLSLISGVLGTRMLCVRERGGTMRGANHVVRACFNGFAIWRYDSGDRGNGSAIPIVPLVFLLPREAKPHAHI